MSWRSFFGIKEKRDNKPTDIDAGNNISLSLPFLQNYYEGRAMNLSAVYRATELISDGVAILPIRIYNNSSKCKNIDEEHPLNLVFTDSADNLITKYNMIKLMIQSVILRGNGYAYIWRDGNGTATNIQYIESEDVIINYNKYANTLYYQITNHKGLRNKIEPCNMIHLVKNSWNGIEGVSILSYASRCIENSQSTEESAKNFFSKGCNLSGTLTVTGAPLSAEKKLAIRQAWQQTYTDGGSGLAVLEGNMQYQPIQVSSKDSQMLESRLYNVQDIARFFGINPVLLGDLSHSSYGSIEAIQNDFLVHTLQPYIEMVEREFNRKLLTPTEKRFLKIQLETNEILRTDKTAQATYYGAMLTNGIMCINEVRKELGYNPIEGGDKHMIPYTDINQNTINNTSDEENNKEQ